MFEKWKKDEGFRAFSELYDVVIIRVMSYLIVAVVILHVVERVTTWLVQ